MILHPDIMIFELLELYFKITNENSINIDILESSFYALESIINDNEDTNYNYDFFEILNSFAYKYQDYIDLDDDELIVNCDLDILLDAILEVQKSYSEIDQTICTYLENITIFKAFKVEIPYIEMQDFFKLNQEIIETYSNIASLEAIGIKNNLIIYYLKKLIKKLNHELTKLDSTDLLKIKMCCADLNTCLSPNCETFENSAWHIALFSHDSLTRNKINYARLEYLANELSFLLEDYEDYTVDEDDLEEVLARNIAEYEDNNDLNLFLSFFLIELSNYILNNDLPTTTKNELIAKKYHLLSMPELHKIEEYYLKTSDIITSLPPIEPSYYAKTTFDIFLATVYECSLSLDYSNEEIHNNPEIYSEIIINALFIKNFFNLSLNEKAKSEITTLITSSSYYGLKEDYSIAINIINEIIFHNQHHLER